jgi:hypothetical protein
MTARVLKALPQICASLGWICWMLLVGICIGLALFAAFEPVVPL